MEAPSYQGGHTTHLALFEEQRKSQALKRARVGLSSPRGGKGADPDRAGRYGGAGPLAARAALLARQEGRAARSTRHRACGRRVARRSARGAQGSVPRQGAGRLARAPDPAQGAGAEALRRRHPRARHRLRHRPGGHRQDLPGDGDGGARAAGQAGQAHRADAPGGRGGREARLPARHDGGEGLPVPAAALRRAARHDGLREGRPSCWSSAASSRWRRSPSCAAARSTTRS